MDLLPHLRTLSETAGPSGSEHAVAAVIGEAWAPFTDEQRIDPLGSLIAVKSGTAATELAHRPTIMLAAHMDEIGLMVKDIVAHPDEDGYGFLRLTNVGGVDRRQVYGQLVTVHGKEPLTGVVGGLPASMLPAGRKTRPYDYAALVVDTGLSYKELREQVSVGDFVSFQQPVRELLNGRAAGKAFDNRASVAAVTVCLEYLQGRDHLWNVAAVATIQEEVGLVGAYTSASALAPDAAIAIDVIHATGPGAKGSQTFALGGGPVVEIGPNIHPGMRKAIKQAAGRLEMKTQTSIHTRSSGTDAHGIQVSAAGIPTGLISLPLRYMHTMVETLSLKDVTRTGRLLGETIAGLDDQFLAKLADTLKPEKVSLD